MLDLRTMEANRFAEEQRPADKEKTKAGSTVSRLDLSFSGYEQNCLFHNLGDGTFQEIGSVAGAGRMEDGRGFAVFDFDQDGDLDIVLRSMPPHSLMLLRNDVGNRRGWLRLKLIGTKSNRDAVGARVKIETPRVQQLRQVSLGEGYLSGQSRVLHFGLDDARAAKVRVTWPSGLVQEIESLAGNRLWTIEEGGAPK